MRKDDITAIERALGVTLPDDYAQLLLAYPFDEDRDAFYGSVEEIIDDTLLYREHGMVGGTWLDQWVVIGNVGNGDHWFIDSALQTSPVFATSHDGAPPVQQDAASVAEWVEFLQAEVAKPEEEHRREHEELMAKAQRVRDFFALDLRKKS